MAAANRIRPHDVFTDEEWQALSARQAWRGPLLVLHGWAIIAGAMALFAIFPNPLTFVIAVMLVGARQLGLAILMHEAAHGALHPNRRINDFLGHWLCAAPVGAHLDSYRTYHLKHHKYVQQEEDPDLVLSAPFPTTKDSIRRKLIRDITGQTFFKQRFSGQLSQFQMSKAAKKQAQVVTSRTGVRDHLLVNVALFAVLALIGYWWLYPVIWVVALATWFPMVTRIRNIAEHACVPDSEDPLAHARTTHASWWERLLIAPYWVHYHSEHHAFMHLPCYRLPQAHKMLQAKGHGARIPQAGSYLEILKMAGAKPVS
jgi:fatty acid desaturase